MKLDEEEQALLTSIENDEWQLVANLAEEKERVRSIARATGAKDERMNIRINRRDIMALKARALERGVPYQTLVSGILRQWLRTASPAGRRPTRLGSLFAENETEGLATLLRKHSARPVRKGDPEVREPTGMFAPRRSRDSFLDKLSSGSARTLSDVELSGQDAAEVFERLLRIQGRTDLSESEVALLEVALTRLKLLVRPVVG